MYFTVQGFDSPRVRNDDLSASQWCADGRLMINGLAVGPGVDEVLVSHRRTDLTDWFDISDQSQEQKVFDAAAVLLKSDPSRRDQLPPGATTFVQSISVSSFLQ